MERAEQIAQSFIADEDLSRGVEDLARAVDSANATFVSVAPVLVGLAANGSTGPHVLAERVGLSDDELVVALARLQDLGLVTVSRVGEDQVVALTAGGSLAARQIGD